MARPAKHEYEKRSEQVKIRLTIAEREHLNTQATNAGYNVAEFVRRRAVGHVVAAPARPKFDPAMVSLVNQTNLELRACGNNINQIARNLNSGRPQRIAWDEAQKQLQQLIEKSEAILEKLVDSDDS